MVADRSWRGILLRGGVALIVESGRAIDDDGGRTAMPRYYFHITGRFEVEDDEGEEFPDVAAAMVLALRMASEGGRDREEYRGCFVRVPDDKGDELARIP